MVMGVMECGMRNVMESRNGSSRSSSITVGRTGVQGGQNGYSSARIKKAAGGPRDEKKKKL